MSRRKELEHEVSLAQERIKKAPKDTPREILKIWEQELVDLEVELNNLVDDEEDNNDWITFLPNKRPVQFLYGLFQGNRILPATFGNGYA